MLYAVKTANSTYGHHGEMAWLQVWLSDEVVVGEEHGPLPPFLIVATALSALVWAGVMVWACRRRRERMRTHGHGLGSHTGPLLAPDIQRL